MKTFFLNLVFVAIGYYVAASLWDHSFNPCHWSAFCKALAPWAIITNTITFSWIDRLNDEFKNRHNKKR